MSPLPLRVFPVPRETLPSFLARMAAVNGLSTREFAIDMGFNLRKVINLDPVAIGLWVARGGSDDAVLEDMISWTGRSVGDVRTQFRGEVLVSRAIRNPVIRGCPQCLSEDAETNPDAPRTFMAMRGDWQFRDVSICLRHEHVLVPLWRASKPLERYDICARLSEIRDELLDRNLERDQVAASAYDRWLDRRLETGSDDTHLASYSLIAAKAQFARRWTHCWTGRPAHSSSLARCSETSFPNSRTIMLTIQNLPGFAICCVIASWRPGRLPQVDSVAQSL